MVRMSDPGYVTKEREEALLDELRRVQEAFQECRAERQQAIDERDAAEQRRDAAEQAFDRKCEALRQAIDALQEAEEAMKRGAYGRAALAVNAALLNLGEQP